MRQRWGATPSAFRGGGIFAYITGWDPSSPAAYKSKSSRLQRERPLPHPVVANSVFSVSNPRVQRSCWNSCPWLVERNGAAPVKIWQFPQKAKYRTTIRPGNSTSKCIYRKEVRNRDSNKYLNANVHSRITHNSHRGGWKQPIHSPTDEWTSKLHNIIQSQIEPYNEDESQKHFAN